MCVFSAVMDHFIPFIPDPLPWRTTPSPLTPVAPIVFPQPSGGHVTPEELERILENFKKALDAAKIVDNLTAQPDCERAEKEELLARVAKLEEQLKLLQKRKKSKRSNKTGKSKRKIKK